jgi:hypothetical protein
MISLQFIDISPSIRYQINQTQSNKMHNLENWSFMKNYSDKESYKIDTEDKNKYIKLVVSCRSEVPVL